MSKAGDEEIAKNAEIKGVKNGSETKDAKRVIENDAAELKQWDPRSLPKASTRK